MGKKRLPKNYKNNVLFLGLVSLFTDLSSQMIYPLIPEFLSSIGTSNTIIGVIEGIAESIASLFRTVFGKLSDKLKKRKLFIFFGYGLSAFVKPFLFFANSWVHVLAVKFFDRIGKASRTPARDALISTSIDSKNKGKAFGFHRAMDRIGAIGGPVLALIILKFLNNNIRYVFLFSFIPALIALIFISFAKETKEILDEKSYKKKEKVKKASFIIFLIANIVFTLGNSSNAFLLLKARETGLEVAMIPLIWILYNFICALTSPIFGTLSDKIGRKPIIISSFLYYSVIYILFAFSNSILSIWILFASYGIYYGLSNGIYRAYIADIVGPEKLATAYGLFNTGIGLALFPASIIMGAIWDVFGSKWAFLTSSVFSLLGFLIFIISMIAKKIEKKIL